MKKTVLMSAAKKARIALAVLAVCGFTFAGAQSAFAALPTTDLPVKTDANKNIICGDGAKVKDTSTKDAIVMGNGAVAEGNYSVVIGFEAKTDSRNDIGTPTVSYNSVAIGAKAKAVASDSTAIGYGATANWDFSTAIGSNSCAKTFGSSSLGYGAKSVFNATAIGYLADAKGEGSVAIGSGSVADEENTVSVGNKTGIYGGPALYRKIVNMADGVDDHDAATVGQVITNIKKNGNTLEFYTGKGADGNGTKKWEFDLAAGGSTLTQTDFDNMLNSSTKFNDLQTAVGNKANANGDNITTGAGSEWANKLGTGTIANGDKNLVNGETVYNKIGDTSQLENANLGNNLSDAVMTVNTKAETALNKAKDNEKKIGDTTQLTTAGLGDNLSDAVVKVNDKVGDTGKLTTAGLGNNLSDAVVKVDDKTKQNAETIKNVNGRVDELGDRVDTLGGAVSKLDTKVNKVGAGAAALAALHPMEFDSDNKLTFAAGVGSYHGASAAAIGAFYRPSEQVMFSIAGNMGNGENMVNAGVSFALDRPSKTPTTKAMMAKKLAEQEQMLAEQSREIAELKAIVQQLAAKQSA